MHKRHIIIISRYTVAALIFYQNVSVCTFLSFLRALFKRLSGSMPARSGSGWIGLGGSLIYTAVVSLCKCVSYQSRNVLCAAVLQLLCHCGKSYLTNGDKHAHICRNYCCILCIIKCMYLLRLR